MLSTIALVAVLIQQNPAVSRPPMSGVWRDGNEQLKLTLSGDSLTVTSGSQTPMTYRTDGSVSRNVSKSATGAEWKYESTARWVGNALLLVTKTTRETGGTWEWLTIYSLDSESGNLTTVTVDHAAHEEGRDGMLTRLKAYRRIIGG